MGSRTIIRTLLILAIIVILIYCFHNGVKVNVCHHYTTSSFSLTNALAAHRDSVSGPPPLILIAIPIRASNAQRRVLVRNWMNRLKLSRLGIIKLLFFLEKPNESITDLIQDESRTYKDLVILYNLEEESEDLLKLKTYRILKYIEENHIQSKYVMKLDDNIYIDLNDLVSIMMFYSSKKLKNEIFCFGEISKDKPQYYPPSNDRSVIVEARSSVCDDCPLYASGDTFIISRSIITHLFQHEQYLGMLKREDFMIGLWIKRLQEINNMRVRFPVTYINLNGQKSDFKYLYINSRKLFDFSFPNYLYKLDSTELLCLIENYFAIDYEKLKCLSPNKIILL